MIWFPHGTVGATPQAPPPASSLVREASEARVQASGGAVRTYSITIPPSLSNSLLVYGNTWFTGGNGVVSAATFDGVDIFANEIGTQQPGFDSDTRDGLYMGFMANPPAGTADLVITNTENQGTNDVSLVYWIYSGADTANFPDAFIDPNHESNTNSFAGALTTTVDDCALGFMVIDFNAAPQGDIPTAGWSDVTPDVGFTEGWFNDDVGAAGLKNWTWNKTGADITVGAFAVAPA